jgi:transglutaminase-like putative cysteine protease
MASGAPVPPAAPSRTVSARLVLDVHETAHLVLQVAVAAAVRSESLRITLNGEPIDPVEVLVPGVGRVHVLDAAPGRVEVAYGAVSGRADQPLVTAADWITYLRPSRYAESDRLGAIAVAEFSGIRDPRELLWAVSSWVGAQLTYVAGSSLPTDGAVDTMLVRQGVCRDYAHLVVALLRALDVPARLAAVYAPGLSPMDFHAVAEAAVDGVWCAVDATLLAPRASLVRIASGRDAADTAFLSTYGGQVDLLETEVTATVQGQLPADDVTALVSIG